MVTTLKRIGTSKIFPCVTILCLMLCVLGACQSRSPQEVVIYTSLDQLFSEPVLKDFEKNSSIKVKALYDTEVSKTVGLVNRLIAERDNPQADVFWNSEIVRTILLKRERDSPAICLAQCCGHPQPF